MLETFEPGIIPSLKLILKLLSKIDNEVFKVIEQTGDSPTFALSWILTWFSHEIITFIDV